MAELTVSTIAIAGVQVSASAAAGGGDSFDNYNGDTFLYINNGGGGSITLTITAQAGPDGLTITNPTVSVGASETHVVGPFPPQWFNDASGEVNVTYSGVTSVTVQAFKLKGA